MEISFVCLREDGCLELPATVETACRTAARKVPELEGFHFHTLRHPYVKLKTKNNCKTTITSMRFHACNCCLYIREKGSKQKQH